MRRPPPFDGRAPHPVLALLAGGDRRSIGASNAVVAKALAETALVGVLFEGMAGADPVVRMRCADALEKISARRPDVLVPHKVELLEALAQSGPPEVRWHVAPMLARLPLSKGERTRVLDTLMAWLDDRSAIVRVFSMQAIADLAATDPAIAPRVLPRLRELAVAGTPAVRARGRRLVAALEAIEAARAGMRRKAGEPRGR